MYSRRTRTSEVRFRRFRRRIGCAGLSLLILIILSPPTQAQLRDQKKTGGWKYRPKRSWKYHPKRSWNYIPKTSWKYQPTRFRQYRPKQSWKYHPTQRWEQLSSLDTQRHAYRITCTTHQISELVQQVAGERASVEETGPYLDTLKRGYVPYSLRADIIFHIGVDSEGKPEETLERIARTRPVYAVTEAMAQSALLKLPGVENLHDPHVWMDIVVWKSFARMIGQRLSEFDSTNEGYYLSNYLRYAQQLDLLRSYAQHVLSTIPEKSRVLITNRTSFGYLVRGYGLEARTIEDLREEFKTDAQVIEFLMEREIEAVFADRSSPNQDVEALIDRASAEDYDMVLGGMLLSDPTDAPGTYEGTYIGMLDYNITAIARGLGGSAPRGGMQGELSGALAQSRNPAANRP